MSVRRFALLLFTVVALGSVSSAGATPPGTNGRIAFTSSRHGNAELYSVAPDGTSLRRLTWTSATEQEAAWSPDGSKITYERAKGGEHFRLWTMNADGTAQAQITPTSLDNYDDSDPAWSPDGTLIAFGSTRSGTWNIWVIRSDGTGLRRVTSEFGVDPSWSPDGTKLVFSGLGGIAVVNADGTNAHTISGPGTPPNAPSWSPDGAHIVFARNDASGFAAGEVYVANADGSGETQLTSDGFHNSRPTWSPDGTRVVFQRSAQTSGEWQLWSIGADGLGLQPLITGPAILPDWGTSQIVPEPQPPDAPIIDIYAPNDGQVFLPGMNPIAFYQCSSFVSPIVSCVGDVPVGAQVDTTFGDHTFAVRAVDSAGRTATAAVTYTIPDLTPPQIDLRTPSSGATYDLDSDVTVDFSCSDPGGSGIAQCAGDLPNGSRLNTDYPGTRTFHVFALDNAGRLREVTATYTVVDRRPPRVIIQSPFEGHDYSLGSAWSVNYYCWSPGTIHIVSCEGPVPNGDLLDTASVGPHVFAVTATDANGKTTTASVPYRVIYLFHGFDPPVDTGSNLDGVRAGDNIAVKFSLDGDHGLGVVTKTTWQAATCGDWIPTGAANPVDGKLTYSASVDRYKEVVATSTSWRGSCRFLRLYLDDGTTPEVRVHFKK
jgi:hypothetical protein